MFRYCAGTHCWNLFFFLIIKSYFPAWSLRLSCFISTGFSASSILSAPRKPWWVGSISGPLSCLVSLFWTFTAQPENVFAHPSGNFCHLFLTYLWDSVMLLSCHIGQRNWQRSMLIFLDYVLRSKRPSGLTLEFPHKFEDFCQIYLLSTAECFPLLGCYCFYLLFLSLSPLLSPHFSPFFPPLIPVSAYDNWRKKKSPSTSCQVGAFSASSPSSSIPYGLW